MLVQVVHLVRDPRAMITSITKRSGVWSDALKNSTYQCKRMLDDMKIEEGLPEERCKTNFNTEWSYLFYFRYIRVRYEDLVDKTLDTVTNLYNRLGLGFSEKVKNVVFAHTHAENITGTNG